MYKTLGDYKWSSLLTRSENPNECSASLEDAIALNAQNIVQTITENINEFDEDSSVLSPPLINEFVVDDSNILSTAENFQISFKSLKNVSFTTFVNVFQINLFFPSVFRCSQSKCIVVFSVLQRGGVVLFGLVPPP
jgi:hypothetical protein